MENDTLIKDFNELKINTKVYFYLKMRIKLLDVFLF